MVSSMSTEPPEWDDWVGPAEAACAEAVSTEAIRTATRRLWEAIKAFLRAVIDWLRRNGDGVHWQAQQLMEESYQIEDRLRRHGSRRPRRKEVQLTKHIASLSVAYRPPKDAASLLTPMRTLDSTLATYFAYRERYVVNAFREHSHWIEKGMEQPNLVDNARSPNETTVGTIIQQAGPAVIEQDLGIALRRGAWVGPRLLGNKQLELRGRSSDNDSPHIREELVLTTRTADQQPLPASLTIPSADPTLVRQLLKRVQGLLTHVKGNYDSRTLGQVQKHLRTLQTLTDQLESRAGQATEDLQAYRTLARYCRILGKRLTEPAAGLAGQTLRSSRGVLHLCWLNSP